MKTLILICGSNGIGKSTASAELLKRLPNSAYVESDYCRMMNPFEFTDETVEVVKNNIFSLMLNYLKCSAIDNVIFPYGFHGRRKQIFESIMVELSKEVDFKFCPIILICTEDENIRRMRKNWRDEERIKRAVKNTREIYNRYDYPKIDVTDLTVGETVDEIIKIVEVT